MRQLAHFPGGVGFRYLGGATLLDPGFPGDWPEVRGDDSHLHLHLRFLAASAWPVRCRLASSIYGFSPQSGGSLPLPPTAHCRKLAPFSSICWWRELARSGASWR